MRLSVLIMVLALGRVAIAATPEELFAQANAAFAQATAQRSTDEPAARSAYATAISLYRQLINDHRIANPDLYFNLANAYALSGDLGHAVLNYRRAQRLAPHDADIAANYAATRARIGSSIDQKAGGQLSRSLLAWHKDIPPRIRLTIALACFAACWLMVGLRLIARLRPLLPRALPTALVVIAALAVFSLWSQERNARLQPEAVVVAESVVGRKGPDATGYEPSFTRPLSAGVEVTILERRPGWALVRLADARETWLPEGSWEEV